LKTYLKSALLICSVALVAVMSLAGKLSKTNAAVQPTPSGYGYVVARSTGVVDIIVASAQQNQQILQQFTVPMPDFYPQQKLIHAKASPNEQWLLLVYDGIKGTRLQLVNMTTRQSELIRTITGSHKTVPVWSPDSKFIAYVGEPFVCVTPGPTVPGVGQSRYISNSTTGSNQSSAPGLYVYDLASKTSQLIVTEVSTQTPNIFVTGFYWSPDSKKMLIIKNEAYRGLTEKFLTVYSLADQTEITFTQYSPSHPICQGQWSPNGNYFSFELNCDSNFNQYFHEIFLYDTTLSPNSDMYPIKQITEESNPAEPPENYRATMYSVTYSTLWLDDNKLLVGVGRYRFVEDITENGSIASPLDTIHTKLQVYDLQSRQTSVLYSSAVFDLAKGQTEIAFRSLSIVPDEKKRIATANPKTILMQLSDKTGTVTATLEAGCNYLWASSQPILAYEVRSSMYFYSGKDLEKLVFADRANNQVYSYTLPAEDKNAMVVGWVKTGKND